MMSLWAKINSSQAKLEKLMERRKGKKRKGVENWRDVEGTPYRVRANACSAVEDKAGDKYKKAARSGGFLK
jgi:hypothetical protein